MPELTRTGRTQDSLWRDPSIRILFAVCFAGLLSFSVSMTAVPVWAVRVGHPEALVGTITGAMLAFTVATQFLSVRLLDRFDHRTLLAVGLLLLGLPMPLLLLADTFATVLAISAVRGVGFAIVTVVGALTIPRAAPPERQGEATGIFGLAAAVPMTVGIAGGAALALNDLFLAVVVLGSAPVLVAPLLLKVRPSVPDADATRAPLLTITRRLWLPAGAVLLVTAAGGGLMTLLPLIRPTDGFAPLAIFALCLVATVVRWRVGAVLDGRAPRVPLVVLMVSGLLGLGGTAAGLALGHGTGAWLVALGTGLFGVAYGGVQTVTLDMALRMSPGPDQAGASAIWNAAFDAGTAAGAALVTMAAYSFAGPAGTVGVSAAVIGAAALVIAAALRPRTAAQLLPGGTR